MELIEFAAPLLLGFALTLVSAWVGGHLGGGGKK